MTNPSRGVFYVEFVGELAKSAQPLLGIEMFSQDRGGSPSARLPITAEVPIDLELGGAANAPMIFEIAAWDAQGSKTVLVHTTASLVNNAIDDNLGVDLEIQHPGSIMTVTETVYIDASQAAPLVQVSAGFSGVPAQAGQEVVFSHSLNTRHPQVRVELRTATSPETWIEVPDDQYQRAIALGQRGEDRRPADVRQTRPARSISANTRFSWPVRTPPRSCWRTRTRPATSSSAIRP